MSCQSTQYYFAQLHDLEKIIEFIPKLRCRIVGSQTCPLIAWWAMNKNERNSGITIFDIKQILWSHELLWCNNQQHWGWGFPNGEYQITRFPLLLRPLHWKLTSEKAALSETFEKGVTRIDHSNYLTSLSYSINQVVKTKLGVCLSHISRVWCVVL